MPQLVSITNLVKIREFYKKNFFVKINALYSNSDKKWYLKNSNNCLSILFNILYMLPFFLVKILFYILNYDIIYTIDNIHKSTNEDTTCILPVILKCNFVHEKDEPNKKAITDETNESDEINVKDIIKYYNPSIPLNYIIKNNNWTKYNKIKIKYFNKGKLIEKEIYKNDYDNYRLFNLFED